MPETLPHESSSYRAIPLGNGSHILVYRVVKGALVRRGYLLNWREDCEGESDEKERGEELRELYITPASSWAYDASQCVGCNWIWIQKPSIIYPRIWQEGCLHTARLPLPNPRTVY